MCSFCFYFADVFSSTMWSDLRAAVPQAGAPNDQFVAKCIIMPQLIKINVIKAFSGVFQYCWEKIICSFFPARHTRNFPARKIKLVGFPASCKLSSQQAEKRHFSTSYIEMGVAQGLKSTLQSFPTKIGLKCLKTSFIPRWTLHQ